MPKKPKRINTTDYIKKITAERLENAYKFECRYCKDKFDTRTDFFITANYLTVWEKFPEGEMQMYCSKYCANEENWTCDNYTENSLGHYACDICDCSLNKYKDPFYTAEFISGRKRWYCVACEEAAEKDIKDKTTRNLEFHNEDSFGETPKPKVEHCSQCDCELTDLTGCYAAEDELLCPKCFDAVGKCPKCDNDCELDGKCFDCEIAKCPEICWRNAMGNYTERLCSDVYINVYVNSNCRKLRPDEELLLNEIYLRSGNKSRNPYIFRLL